MSEPSTKLPSVGKVRFTDTTASVLLDLVRGLAAVLVMAGHLRNMLFVDFHQAAAAGSRAALFFASPYVLTSGGHQAVIVFFVLSGYLISGSVFRLFERNQWRGSVYLTHRLVRLWIVLLPGLLLCLLCDSIGLHSHHAHLLYHGLNANHVTGNNIAQGISAKIFFGNAFFLQTILVPTFGSDGALWSLANEFWYYILFPLGLIVLRRRSPPLRRVLCGAGFLAVAWFVRGGILESFPIWLLGTALLFVRPPRLGAAARWVAAAFYLPLLLLFAKANLLPGVLQDYAFGAITAVFFWVLLSATGPADPQSMFARGSRRLSRFSYTLYVVHPPFVLLCAAWLLGDARWRPTPAHVALAAAVMLATLMYAFGVAALTEFHTDSVRRWAERTLGLVQRPRPDPHRAAMSGKRM